MNPNDNEIIETLYKDFQRAEKISQEVKGLTCDKFIFGIETLKDVGWYFIKWSISKQKEDLYEASGQAKQAIYESAQSGITFYLKQIEIFRENYGEYIDNSTLSGYSTKMSKINEIKEEYVSTMKNKSSSYEECYNAFQELRKIHNELIAIQPELNKKKNNKQKKKIDWPYIISLVLSIAASTTTIIFAIK